MQHLNSKGGEDEGLAYDEVTITSQILKEAMSRVYIEGNDPGHDYDFDTRLDETGMESLHVAELIVELEEIVGKQLDLVDVERFETLGDLCRALRATGDLL